MLLHSSELASYTRIRITKTVDLFEKFASHCGCGMRVGKYEIGYLKMVTHRFKNRLLDVSAVLRIKSDVNEGHIRNKKCHSALTYCSKALRIANDNVLR